MVRLNPYRPRVARSGCCVTPVAPAPTLRIRLADALAYRGPPFRRGTAGTCGCPCRLELGRRDVAAGAVEAARVPEVDPGRSGQLESVKRALRPLASDELGLAETVDGLGQGVVIGIAAGSRPRRRHPRRRVARCSGMARYWTPRSRWWTSPPRSADRRLQIAISRASRASSARRLAETHQPTIRRLKASTSGLWITHLRCGPKQSRPKSRYGEQPKEGQS